ncbi:carbon-nitrogen hydrolase family protein [Streptosporangium sp. 'caverna']|uniref:carbon-nitrogen hydrolase family protein n=1 Tax=Streptosporangium TaxID=2000 RepID=UPI000D7E4CDF|nr:carbon-nitrogen hydrolase family protein [Streptosporangium sp. 'caverna']AWS45297.1 nitrilase [Streptosporangium sp. 'caverna']WSA20166.1 carbon-nitrogen hydrolase family protein [Streptosporangium subroseum]
MTRIALCQIPVSEEPAANLSRAREAMDRAAADGADLAIFPEATLTRYGKRITDLAEPLDGPFVTGLAESARAHGLAVIVGVFEPGDDLVHNTAVAIGSTGRIEAAYRKIHLFDSFGARESDLVSPGSVPVVVELAGLRIGLVTCYDIRFPELTRALVDEGAELFAVIAAWGSGPMKEEHWTTLVRARAIENTTWVAAVGQAPNPEARDGFGIGRSMLVDPMGVVRADLGPAPSVQTCSLDSQITIVTRNALPCLEHRRLNIGRS